MSDDEHVDHGTNNKPPRSRREEPNPLHDPDLERAFLCSILRYPEILLECDVCEADFYSHANAKIFAARRSLVADGEPGGMVELQSRLHERRHLAAVGGVDYLLEIDAAMPTSTGPWNHIRVLAARRRARDLAMLVSSKAGDDQEFARYFDQLAAAKRDLDQLSNESKQAQPIDPARPLLGLERLQKIAVYGLDALTVLADVSVNYVWQDIAVAGTIVLIAGEPSGGKTTLTFMILVARATRGGPVMLLERLVAPAPPGKWLVLIEAEHSESSTARKLLRTADLLGVDRAALGRVIVIARKQVVLGSPEWDEIKSLIARGLVGDAVIDTAARFAPADANDERDQVQIFDVIAQAIECAPPGDDKPVVWIVAHTKKATTGDLTDVSGSTQRVGQADTVLLVKGTKVDGRTVSSKVTFAKLREDPDDYPRPVVFAIERDGATSRQVLRVGGVVSDERPLTTRIVDLIRERGPQKKRDLVLTLERSGADVEAAITTLFAQRRLVTGTVTVRGVERKTFALAPPPEISRDDSRDEVS